MSSRTFRLTIFQYFSGILHFLKSIFCSIATQTPRQRIASRPCIICFRPDRCKEPIFGVVKEPIFDVVPSIPDNGVVLSIPFLNATMSSPVTTSLPLTSRLACGKDQGCTRTCLRTTTCSPARLPSASSFVTKKVAWPACAVASWIASGVLYP